MPFEEYLRYADVFLNPVKVQYRTQNGHWVTYSEVRTLPTIATDVLQVRMLRKLRETDIRVRTPEGYILR